MSQAQTINDLARKLTKFLAITGALVIFLAAAPLHAQTYNDLYDFICSTGGCTPYDFGYLTEGRDGNLYGTTVNGEGTGGSAQGTVFMVTAVKTPPATYTTIWQFDGPKTGSFPQGGLTLASDGYFYGATSEGGSFGEGTLFRTSGTPGDMAVLHHFTAAEGYGVAPPVQAWDGNLYGVTSAGATYRFAPSTLTYKDLPGKAPGAMYGPLLQATDLNLYGSSRSGGKFNLGTVFSLTTGGTVKIVHNFSGLDGTDPFGPLIEWTDGNLYGTTLTGGANGTGEVFQLTLAGKLTVLHSFAPFSGGTTCNTDGGNPAAGLVAAYGLFYGITSVGGTNCDGTIYKANSTGGFAKLDDFDETGATTIYGENAYTTLMEHTNGCLYGATSAGGALNGMTDPVGNVYDLCPQTVIHLTKVEGPIYVPIEKKVTIIGENMGEATAVSFAGVQAQFQPGSETFLTATVPTDAVDGFVTVTLTNPAGGEEQIESEQKLHILPSITNLDPSSGPAGTQVGIVGGGFTRAKQVTFGGIKASSFTVVSPSLIQAIVPAGAKTGKVGIITPNGSILSKETFTVN